MLFTGGGSGHGGSTSSRGVLLGKGGSYRGRGQGTFQSSCHILHYHMVLRSEGTSHNKVPRSPLKTSHSEQRRTVYHGAEPLMNTQIRTRKENNRSLEPSSALGLGGVEIVG